MIASLPLSFQVQVVNNRDFPDVTNGAIRESFVALGTQTYVQLFPKYVRGNQELRDVRSDIRNCVFDDEVFVIYKKYYTYGECILTCRLSDIIRMCGCTPPGMVGIHNATWCDLADLLCLIRFNGMCLYLIRGSWSLERLSCNPLL